MLHFIRRSLLVQLLSVYLLFVVVVLTGGIAVDALVEQQLRNDAQVSDQALAQEIALQTSVQLHDAEDALISLGKLVVQTHTSDAIITDFRTFQAARNTVDHVYWLDPLGGITVAWPPVGIIAEFSPPNVVQQARIAIHPVFEVGIVEIAAQTPVSPGVIIAAPMRSSTGNLVGIIAVSLSLQELSDPLTSVVQAQQHQGRRLLISIIDDQGRLVATPDHARMLQTVLDELPGANSALQGHTGIASGTRTRSTKLAFQCCPRLGYRLGCYSAETGKRSSRCRHTISPLVAGSGTAFHHWWSILLAHASSQSHSTTAYSGYAASSTSYFRASNSTKCYDACQKR